MAATIWGVVRDGKIVPQTPLPDGLQVQITLPEDVVIPGELQAELDAWSQASAEALVLVEQLAEVSRRHAELRLERDLSPCLLRTVRASLTNRIAGQSRLLQPDA